MFMQFILLVILTGINAFFTASEIALITLNDNKIRLMAEDGDKKAIILTKLLSEPMRFLSTIQIGITMAGFLASAFASDSFSGPLVLMLQQLNLPFTTAVLKTFTMIFITAMLSFFTLVLGELVPKRIAMNMAEPIAFGVAKTLRFLSVALSPIVRLLIFTTNFFIRLFGFDPNQEADNVTEEEIRMMVDVGEEKGTIRDTEKEMINNVFEFDNMIVSDIMTHRTEISGINVEATLQDVKQLVFEDKYTRFPVYEDSIDDIIGILHVKDLIRFIENQDIEQFSLSKIIRTPYYVPESKRTDVLFRELQKTKTHMAIVIDEYGGTAGIVTIEDLIEEIVGNIFDEYDEDESEIQKIDDVTYDVDGSVNLDDIEEDLEISLPIEEYDTLSGFIIGQLGRIPNEVEHPEIIYKGIIYRIVEVDEKRITRVRIIKPSVIPTEEV